VQRLQRHHELRGRAVRVGDDVLLGEARDRIRVTSGTISGTSGSIRQADELSITTAPAAPIFGDHSFDTAPPPTSGRCRRRKIVMLERFDLQGAVAIGHLDADAAARGQHHDLVGGEFALVENVEHFAPDIAGRTDDSDFVTHRSLSEEKCRPPRQAEREEAALLCEKRRS
jgi:hypothetical protein